MRSQRHNRFATDVLDNESRRGRGHESLLISRQNPHRASSPRPLQELRRKTLPIASNTFGSERGKCCWARASVCDVLRLVNYDEKLERSVTQSTAYAFRLKPGDDLKKSIQRFVEARQIHAGWIASCAGSLTDYHIRFANKPTGSRRSGHFEIVSLSGTLSTNGSHLHIAVSDGDGHTVGGHLLDECVVYTTAEIIIQSTSGLVFTREKDSTTQWAELQIKEH